MRDVALRVGITERAVQRIVAELEEGGYLTIALPPVGEIGIRSIRACRFDIRCRATGRSVK